MSAEERDLLIVFFSKKRYHVPAFSVWSPPSDVFGLGGPGRTFDIGTYSDQGPTGIVDLFPNTSPFPPRSL